jgi:Na+-transporting NADH:ubiquinone oxidoreductase subunit B
LALALALAVFWPLAFARIRRLPMAWHSMISAAVMVLLLPNAVPLWHLGLALSFGLVMGDLIFGAHGRGFLNPSVVGLAFLLFSFPDTANATLGQNMALAAMAGGLLLLGLGLLAWRVVAGFAAALALLMTTVPTPWDWVSLHGASLLLGLVFLIGDPVAAASTNAGRWLYGVLAAALVGLLGLAGGDGGSLSVMIFAALLASIFAPLIDQIVIAANVRRRALRQADV